MNPKIKIENLQKKFAEKQILKDINLDIFEKESVVILGGSGCGKSVLIKIIATLMKADSGKIFIDGQDIIKFKENEKDKLMDKFGFLFQGGALFDSLKK
jgi:phospholipid/cholesterol/gamma-HCH transport system ATP-binding protein